MNFHSGGVSVTAFLSSDQQIISSGQSDYCLIQWKLAKKEPTEEERRQERKKLMYNVVPQPPQESSGDAGRYTGRRLSRKHVYTRNASVVEKQQNGTVLTRPTKGAERFRSYPDSPEEASY